MDMRNKADATPLHLAARHAHIEIARFLCLAGLNLSIQDKVSFPDDFAALMLTARAPF